MIDNPPLPKHLSNVSPPSHKESEQSFTYALVGNPNSGKTTLFNHLTGLKQKVGNYPGVTIEKKIGTCFSQHGQKMTVIDLPGAYSLSAHSPDEKILNEVALGQMEGSPRPDRFICIVDASNLERNLYLAAQIAELGRPTILVLNMMDIADKQGIHIDTDRIQKELGVTVITTQAHKKKGLIELKLAMSKASLTTPSLNIDLPKPVSEAVLKVQSHLISQKGENLNAARGEALLLLTEDSPSSHDPALSQLVSSLQEKLKRELCNWKSLVIAARYNKLGELCKKAVLQKSEVKKSLTEHFDDVLLHKTYGWLTLFLVMGTLFWSIFFLSEYPMHGIEWAFNKLGSFTESALPAGPLQDLLVNGVITGVGSVLMFLPQILMLFFFIGFLESSGYLPRAAFMLDKVMSKVGLQGKSFIPLLSSYACAIPGIMATRTISSPKERLATILIAPWMSCSARLPIYLLMIATLASGRNASPIIKAGILMGAYALGTFVAFGTAWILRKTILKGPVQHSVMELPAYRLPSFKNTIFEMLQHGKLFLKRAGTLILAFSIVLWFLMSHPAQDPEAIDSQLETSYIGQIGHLMEPAIKPLGYDWKMGIGILSSFAARELFISTMAQIYHAEDNFEDETTFAGTLQKQRNPSGQAVFTPLTCISLMVFFIFAMQCMSTLAIVKKETNSWRWPLFQLVYMTGFAYLAALIVYQGGKLLGFA